MHILLTQKEISICLSLNNAKSRLSNFEQERETRERIKRSNRNLGEKFEKKRKPERTTGEEISNSKIPNLNNFIIQSYQKQK